jgi:uncharacterized protein
MESLVVPVPGDRRLSATLFGPPGTAPQQNPLPGLLFVHGRDADQYGYQVRARAVIKVLDVVCLTFDLGGHGTSGGELDELTPRDHLADVTAAYDVLVAHPRVDPSRIGVCAASYGAYLAALLCGERAVRRLMLRAPGLYPDDRLDEPLRVRRRSAAHAGSTIATRNLAAVRGDVLILESGADEQIPHEVVVAYLRARPDARHVTIPGAPHQLADPALRQRFLDEIVEFFTGL